MNILGSKSFHFNGLDWQAVKRTIYRGAGGIILAVIPSLISPTVQYTVVIKNHTIDYSWVVVIIGTAIVRAVEAYLSDNSAP